MLEHNSIKFSSIFLMKKNMTNERFVWETWWSISHRPVDLTWPRMNMSRSSKCVVGGPWVQAGIPGCWDVQSWAEEKGKKRKHERAQRELNGFVGRIPIPFPPFFSLPGNFSFTLSRFLDVSEKKAKRCFRVSFVHATRLIVNRPIWTDFLFLYFSSIFFILGHPVKVYLYVSQVGARNGKWPDEKWRSAFCLFS